MVGNRFNKLIAQVVASVLVACFGLFDDGQIVGLEWVLVAFAAVSAVSVVIVPNLSEGIARYAKGVVAIAIAVLGALVGFWQGGIDTSEAIQLVLLGLGAIGVTGIENVGYQFPVPAGRHAAIKGPRAA